MNLSKLNRRDLLLAGGSLTAASCLSRRAYANPHYSFMQGEFQITVLSDGFISVPDAVLIPDVAAAERTGLLGRIDTLGGAVRAKCNIPVIRKGSEVVLVDIGGGHKYQKSDGGLTQDLQSAAIDPATVTKVIFTHAHPDHIWATLDEAGGLRFPNATYYVGAAEWDFWMDPDYANTMPAGLHAFAQGAQRDLGAIEDRVVLLKSGDDVLTGLTALETPGHTPGHLSFEIAGGDGLIIAADVANNEVVSFEHPDWKFGYDAMPDVAIQTRVRFIDRATTDRIKMLGYHWEYPGVGYAVRGGGAFRYAKAG